jgi:FlaA1/EpsC-like NDP-sugar epimerase
VLASRGSAIPLFIKQIRDGGPVTLTHREMRRFFMSIPQAVELALTASLEARGGEAFVLKMPVMRIADLIGALIQIYAPRFNRKPEDIAVEEIGLLPGEKLYESLMTPEEALYATELDHYYKVEPLRRIERSRLEAGPTGYDSANEPLLGVDEIVNMLQNHGLVEVFLEALPESPVV